MKKATRTARKGQESDRRPQERVLELEAQNTALHEALARRERAFEEYRDLFEAAPVSYFVVDDRGSIVRANLSATTLLQVDRSLLEARDLRDFVEPANRAAFDAFLTYVFTVERATAEVFPMVEAGGYRFWAEVHAVPEVSRGGPLRCRIALNEVVPRPSLMPLSTEAEALRRERQQRAAVEASLHRSEHTRDRLERQSVDREAQLRLLSHRLFEAQEMERNRISRELHDDIAQILVGILVQLQTLVVEGTPLFAGLERRIERTRNLVEQSVVRVQNFARDLRPAMLDDLGLVPALTSHIKAFAQESPLRIQFEATFVDDGLNNARRTTLFRIAQSALNNVAQHAQATRANVRLYTHGDCICLQVADDGIGFEVGQVDYSDGRLRLGLLGMKERLKMVGGTLVLTSDPNTGTILKATVPKD